MANIRQLKKDIDYLTFAVIDDCLTYNIIIEKNDEKVEEIIRETVSLRNSLRDRINAAPKMENRKEIRNYYREIFKDLMINVDAAFTKLSETVKKS